MIAINKNNNDERAGFHISLTEHANKRIQSRGFTATDIALTLQYGRESHVRGAVYYAVGRREIRRWEKRGIDIHACHGIHVVCSRNGDVITVYRNANLKDLKPHSRLETFDRTLENRRRKRVLEEERQIREAYCCR